MDLCVFVCMYERESGVGALTFLQVRLNVLCAGYREPVLLNPRCMRDCACLHMREQVCLCVRESGLQ